MKIEIFKPASTAMQIRVSYALGQFKHFSETKSHKSALRAVIWVGIFTYLSLKLSTIGWSNVIQNLPTSVYFYYLSIAFVSLPILAERFAFKIAVPTTSLPSFRVFIRKHVLNKAVLNYLGEGYFVKQLAGPGGLKIRDAVILVKDLTLIRTFAANFWIILLASGAIFLGKSDIFSQIFTVSPAVTLSVTLLTLSICLGMIFFFKKLTQLKFSTSAKIAGIYTFRSFLAGAILIAQWSIVLPGTALSVWALFLIVYFIAKKSPVGADLVFLSVALTLPGFEGDSASIAAMLLTSAVVLQIIYSAGFLLTSDYASSLRERGLSYKSSPMVIRNKA